MTLMYALNAFVGKLGPWRADVRKTRVKKKTGPINVQRISLSHKIFATLRVQSNHTRTVENMFDRILLNSSVVELTVLPVLAIKTFTFCPGLRRFLRTCLLETTNALVCLRCVPKTENT